MIAGLPDRLAEPEPVVCRSHGQGCDMDSESCEPFYLSDPFREDEADDERLPRRQAAIVVGVLALLSIGIFYAVLRLLVALLWMLLHR